MLLIYLSSETRVTFERQSHEYEQHMTCLNLEGSKRVILWAWEEFLGRTFGKDF